MWFRYLSLSVLHWIATTAVVFLLVQYVIPQGLHGYWLSAVMWIVMFALAFAFVMWAFHTKMPGKRETIMLIAIWFIATVTIQAAYEINLYGRASFLIYSTDLHIQYALELIAILLGAYLTRRRLIKSVLGEGMSE